MYHLVRTDGYTRCFKGNHNLKYRPYNASKPYNCHFYSMHHPCKFDSDLTDRYSGIMQYIVHSSKNTCRLQHLIRLIITKEQICFKYLKTFHSTIPNIRVALCIPSMCPQMHQHPCQFVSSWTLRRL